LNPEKQNAAIKRIGLFDSGVGGLSILRYIQEKSAGHNQDLKFVYLGDTGRCPYGDRSAGEIISYVKQIVRWLNGAGVDQIVMACNTSAAVAAPFARQVSKVPVHDLISSASRFAANNFESIGVIATSITCKSGAFSRAVKEHNPKCRVCEIPCPDLVPLVEKGMLSGPQVEATISKYVKMLTEFEIDSLIFGCTHFPFLESAFAMQLPDSVTLIDPALHLGLEVLGTSPSDPEAEPFNDSDFQRNTYFCTGDQEKFGRAAELCLRLRAGSLKDSICALSLQELQNPPKESSTTRSTTILKSPFFRGNTSTATPAP
jgi:glutamate racemase